MTIKFVTPNELFKNAQDAVEYNQYLFELEQNTPDPETEEDKDEDKYWKQYH